METETRLINKSFLTYDQLQSCGTPHEHCRQF